MTPTRARRVVTGLMWFAAAANLWAALVTNDWIVWTGCAIWCGNALWATLRPRKYWATLFGNSAHHLKDR